VTAPSPHPGAAAQELVKTFEAYATDADGRIRVEDLLSAASAACGEACLAAAEEVDPERHELTPGSAVLSDRVNGILAGDSVDPAAHAGGVFGIIRAGALAHGYVERDVPAFADVFRGYVAGIAQPDGPGWGFVPLSVGDDHLPRVQPVRAAYELRRPVRQVLAAHAIPTADWPGVCALALTVELRRVREAIDNGVALHLVFETVNGMAKTAPMTDEALQTASGSA